MGKGGEGSESGDWTKLGMSIGGAAIGTMIAPGIGTAAGWQLGSMAGDMTSKGTGMEQSGKGIAGIGQKVGGIGSMFAGGMGGAGAASGGVTGAASATGSGAASSGAGGLAGVSGSGASLGANVGAGTGAFGSGIGKMAAGGGGGAGGLSSMGSAASKFGVDATKDSLTQSIVGSMQKAGNMLKESGMRFEKDPMMNGVAIPDSAFEIQPQGQGQMSYAPQMIPSAKLMNPRMNSSRRRD